jgi:hypothetical protein
MKRNNLQKEENEISEKNNSVNRLERAKKNYK